MRPIRTRACYHERVVRGWLGAGLILALLPEVTYGNSIVGAWGPLQTLGFAPIHSTLLATGKVFWWRSSSNPGVWDPATGLVTNAPTVNYNIFCGGHSLLSSGEVLVTGGTTELGPIYGVKAASSYNPLTNTWTRLPDMNAGRFYPTNATLANGDVVVISGTKEDASPNLIPQVWQVGSRSWRDLTGASVSLPEDHYSGAFLTPNGKIFVVGTNLSYYVSTTGAGAVTAGATLNVSSRYSGSATVYDYSKVIYTGGGENSDVPHSSVEMIDLTATNPVWTYAASMPQPRRQHNATLLPDGTVLVTGGSSASGKNTNDGPKPAINWDPATNQWTIWATETRYRGYHSEALLLPDARVASIGGNGEPSLQIFSPPYLFEPNRPEITSAPASVAYGAQFQVGTLHAGDIDNVNLLRHGSVTHENNMDQRICKLSFTTGANVLNVTAPSTGNICPLGHYLLFILNGSGVPSIARIIRLGGTAPSDTIPPTVSITAPTSGATVSGTVAVSATASDNVGVAGVQFKLDAANLGAEDTTFPYSVTWNSITASNGSHTLTAVARDAAGNIGTSPVVTVTANNPPVSTITIGETNILSVTDSNNGNKLVSQRATLSQTATIQSLSFYVVTASGNLRLGIYDATGPGGGPGAKKAETASITPTTGWNTANVMTPVPLPAGTYWLAYLPSINSLKFKAESTGGTSKLYSFPFGTMPATFSTTPGSSVWRWSLYATLTLNTAPPPPPPPPPAPPPPPPPPPAPPPPPPVSTITIGETSILSVTDGNNGNRLVAQRATLSQAATVQSLSFHVVTASGNLRLGIYDATGPGGGPGAKKAETASITPTTGWNTANVTPVSLPPGTYWLAYLPSSNSLKFKGESSGGTSKLYSFPFEPCPPRSRLLQAPVSGGGPFTRH